MPYSRIVRCLFVGTLLVASAVVVALAAWLLVPVWLEYREQSEIESKLKEIRLSSVEADLDRLFPDSISRGFGMDEDFYFRPLYASFQWYCIVTRKEVLRTEPLELFRRRVDVYRLRVPASNYQAKTEMGRNLASISATWEANENDSARCYGYMGDFIEVLTGRAGEDLGISYELIHTNPPPYAE